MHVDGASAATEPSKSILRVRGLPWSADTAAVRAAIQPLLGTAILDIFLPCDAKGRPSGLAFVTIDDRLAGQRAVDCLQGQYVGDRYLEASLSSGRELRRAREQDDAIRRGVAELAAPPFTGQTGAVRPPVPSDRRDFVVFCHATPPAVLAGEFAVDDLGVGRVDLIARCVSAALFCSHAVRKSVRVWFLLQPEATPGVTAVCCDGGAARWLRPDERTIALALRRALRGEGDGSGWSVQRFDGVESALLHAVVLANDGARLPLLALHLGGAPLAEALPVASDGVVLAMGDHLGFTEREEAALDALGATRSALGAVPLLSSHCIVIAHHVLDSRV